MEDDDDLQASLERAGAQLDAFADGPARDAAAVIEAAFRSAGQAIETSLEQAARAGRLSLDSLAENVLRAIANTTIDQLVVDPLEGLLSSAFRQIPFFGSRADGGPVTPGGAFLVGERGPEMFAPAGAGTVQPLGGGDVNVVINVPPGSDLAAVRRSEGQIAAALARAVARGRRDL